MSKMTDFGFSWLANFTYLPLPHGQSIMLKLQYLTKPFLQTSKWGIISKVMYELASMNHQKNDCKVTLLTVQGVLIDLY